MKQLIARLKVLRSKTLIFFGVAGPFLVDNADSILTTLRESLPQLHDVLPENPYKALSCVFITAGIVLRIYTTTSLKEKSQ